MCLTFIYSWLYPRRSGYAQVINTQPEVIINTQPEVIINTQPEVIINTQSDIEYEYLML